MVYALTLGYRGTAYAGWQRQSNATAVQQVLEEALSEVLGHRVVVTGAGRTDAGVHARGQVAHFESTRDFPDRGLVHATNRALPPDIRVIRAVRMHEDFHARKDAISKEYRYRLTRAAVLSPLDALFSVRARADLEVAAMAAAARRLVGRHDFRAFALSGGSHRSSERTILAAEWQEAGRDLVFRLVGDGFLRGMVRSLVGTLLEVGEGRRTEANIVELLAGRPRSDAGPTAPPQGLELHHVTYPESRGPVAVE